MYLLGLDIGTSSVKASVVSVATQQVVASAHFPETEASISSPQPLWAEQHPDQWWHDAQEAIRRVVEKGGFDAKQISAIGIAYQMHGLVMLDEAKKVLRPAIIWCDSRAVAVGNAAAEALGDSCFSNLLNTPSNFTAAKLAWVKKHEPEIYARCRAICLPGDYISFCLSNELTTTAAALSEGIFWDFQRHAVSEEIMQYFGFDASLIPPIQEVFSVHGKLQPTVATVLGLSPYIPVTYKAGDQPNNALSLNVLKAGEVAATAGTSGVIYGVSDKLIGDVQQRVNSFAHVTHTAAQPSVGVLLCINGTGILNNWLRKLVTPTLSYADMNNLAATAPIGSSGLTILPFGNGAERLLQNKTIGATLGNIDLNRHEVRHLLRAGQEGIAFALAYGLAAMQPLGVQPKVIRAGHANLFLSPLFTEIFVQATQTPVELYDTDGAKGAALAAGIGAGIFQDTEEAFSQLKLLQRIEPQEATQAAYQAAYQQWVAALQKQL